MIKSQIGKHVWYLTARCSQKKKKEKKHKMSTWAGSGLVLMELKSDQFQSIHGYKTTIVSMLLLIYQKNNGTTCINMVQLQVKPILEQTWTANG